MQAQKLCAKKGFAGTTLDEIAREAGVSRALIVQHFGGIHLKKNRGGCFYRD
ncbi:TetR/AcrR family transcriptional regulator [Desulfosarcina sp. BuS5]|uniref:TetR/AcrR family transcriptional regulator n=1 Tax=Desulfosarcina sp. BuS5 TaxID=933262 RepID=UPI0018DE5199